MGVSSDELNRSRHRAALETVWRRLKEHPLARVGPGLITGVADDDPSGIATYSQAGAQFGLNMLWTMPLAFPLMAAIQSMCARIGRVTGKGLAANIKDAFPPIVVKSVVLLLLIANTLNIAADVAAMGEVAELVTGIQSPPDDGGLRDRHAAAAGVHSLSPLRALPEVADALLACLRRGPVHRARALGPGGAAHRLAAIHAQCRRRCRGRRRLRHHHQPLPVLLAGIRRGRGHAGRPRSAAARAAIRAAAGTELRRIRWDTWSGMFYSDLTAYFIILATAVTLHVGRDHRHQHGGAGGERAAAAGGRLRVHAVCAGDSRRRPDRRAGARRLRRLCAMPKPWVGNRGWSARRAMPEASTASSPSACSPDLFIQYPPISPMKALFWSAVINGVVAVPLMAVIILLVSKKSVMGAFTAGRAFIVLGWIATAVMGAAAVWMFIPS